MEYLYSSKSVVTQKSTLYIHDEQKRPENTSKPEVNELQQQKTASVNTKLHLKEAALQLSWYIFGWIRVRFRHIIKSQYCFYPVEKSV